MRLGPNNVVQFKKGSGVVLFDYVPPDSVSDDYILLAQETKQSRGIYVREADLRKANQDNRGLTVYGVWQVVCENNLIDGDGLYVVETGTRNGAYAVVDNGRIIQADRYAGEIGPEVQTYSLEDAQYIDLTAYELSAPAHGAELPEVKARRALKAQTRERYLGLGMVVLAVAAVGGYWFFETSAVEQREKQLSALESQQLIADTRLAAAKLGMVPTEFHRQAQQARLTEFAEVAGKLSGATTESTASLEESPVTVTGLGLLESLSLDAKVSAQPGGGVSVTWEAVSAAAPLEK